MFWSNQKTSNGSPSPSVITVPDKTVARARHMAPGSEVTWIDATMAEIGRNVTHHRSGDPLLDEAIMGAEALLALLHEMRRREG
jgi:hypothetical protein